MTLLYIDGFDHQSIGFGRYLNTPGASSFSTGITRFGSGASFTCDTGPLQRAIPGQSSIYLGIAHRPAATANFLSVFTNNGAANELQICLRRTATGQIGVYRGLNTLIASTAENLLPINVWNYVEMFCVLSNTIGSVVVRLNGTTVIDFTGDTLDTGASTSIIAVGVGSSLPGTDAPGHVDDLYVCNAAGTTNNNFLGDTRVATIVPSGNGASSGLLGSDGNSLDNYLLVDELPPTTDDYVGSPTVGAKDTYQLANTGIAGPIRGIQHNIVANKSDAGSANARGVVRVGTTDYPGATRALSTSAMTYSDVFETNPATASQQWLVSEINALESGMEVVA